MGWVGSGHIKWTRGQLSDSTRQSVFKLNGTTLITLPATCPAANIFWARLRECRRRRGPVSPVSPWIVSETAASVPAFHRSPVTTVTSYDTAETCTHNQQCVSVYFDDAACCSTRPSGRCKVSLRRRRAVLYRRVEFSVLNMEHT